MSKLSFVCPFMSHILCSCYIDKLIKLRQIKRRSEKKRMCLLSRENVKVKVKVNVFFLFTFPPKVTFLLCPFQM